MGRLTRDPEIKYTQGGNSMAIARYTLAVDRRFKRDGEPTADFINCVAFGKAAEFTEKYFRPATNENTNDYILNVYMTKKVPKLSRQTAKYY